MTVRVVVVCDHDGCDRQVGAPVTGDCWTGGWGTVVELDGEAQSMPELAEWKRDGGPYALVDPELSEVLGAPRRDFCPDHAGDAT